jgi:hypothetical protein
MIYIIKQIIFNYTDIDEKLSIETNCILMLQSLFKLTVNSLKSSILAKTL